MINQILSASRRVLSKIQILCYVNKSKKINLRFKNQWVKEAVTCMKAVSDSVGSRLSKL